MGAGLLLTIIGAAAGGTSSIDKLATRYTWSQVQAEEEQQQTLDPSQTFDAVKVTGDADLDIVKGSEDSVKLIYPKDMGSYQMEVKDGTLLVNYSYDKHTLTIFLQKTARLDLLSHARIRHPSKPWMQISAGEMYSCRI